MYLNATPPERCPASLHAVRGTIRDMRRGKHLQKMIDDGLSLTLAQADLLDVSPHTHTHTQTQ
jgi:hypothetical protein